MVILSPVWEDLFFVMRNTMPIPMPAPRYTVLTVFIEVDGERVVIGRYHPDADMKFVKVDNLIPKLDYMYVVEQGSGDLVVESEACRLMLR